MADSKGVGGKGSEDLSFGIIFTFFYRFWKWVGFFLSKGLRGCTFFFKIWDPPLFQTAAILAVMFASDAF